MSENKPNVTSSPDETPKKSSEEIQALAAIGACLAAFLGAVVGAFLFW